MWDRPRQVGRREWGIVSVYESGVRAGRRMVGVRKAVEADRFGRPIDYVARAHALRPVEAPRSAVAEAFLAIARLIVPIALLALTVAAALLYGNEPAIWLGAVDVGGRPFGTGIVALPIALLVVQLTNRRYGASYALLQVIGAVALLTAATFGMRDDIALLKGATLPDPRMIVAFGSALFVAQLISILVFDRLRGPRWWQAPFFASLAGGIVLALVAYPLGYFGTDAQWLEPMASYMGVTAAASAAMLFPYWLLRPLVTPLSGFGGY
jgi:queuosine precursor transporter